ncbi:hemagglutinin protein [Winogradskyella sp. PE311]|uniref:hemagglutinin protein n=1 Tax=Winogradskyella sp. PE311 TaxID=3366943 RepID=UPI00397FCBFB
MKMIKLSIMLSLIIPFGYGQSIEKFSIDSGGASASAGGIQILYTIGEVAVQEVSTSTLSVSEGFINSSFKVKIDPIVYLQGPILNADTGGLMNDDLRVAGLIPTSSPYVDNATCNASVFSVTGTDAIVDWVWIEVRASNDNTKLLNGKSALLQRDGDIVDVDGISTLTMNAPPKDHYVVVKHRNHLGVMSENPIALAEDITTIVDFTDSGFDTFGTNAQSILDSGDTALWAGDVNNNGQVRYLGPNNDTNSIKDAVLFDSGNTSSSNFYPYTAYDNADINMNGQVRYLGPGNDTNILKDIILLHPNNGTLSNFFPFFTTVPNLL